MTGTPPSLYPASVIESTQPIAKNIEREEAEILHSPHRHQRHEGPHDRHKPGVNQCLAAVLCIESLRAANIFLLKKRESGREKTRGPARYPGKYPSDRRHGCHGKHRRDDPDDIDITRAGNTPTVKSKESPGRNNPTSRPISANTMEASSGYPHQPVNHLVSRWISFSGSVRLRQISRRNDSIFSAAGLSAAGKREQPLNILPVLFHFALGHPGKNAIAEQILLCLRLLCQRAKHRSARWAFN